MTETQSVIKIRIDAWTDDMRLLTCVILVMLIVIMWGIGLVLETITMTINIALLLAVSAGYAIAHADGYKVPKKATLPNFYLLSLGVDLAVCCLVLGRDSPIYIYGTITLILQTIIYMLIEYESVIEFSCHVINNLLQQMYFAIIRINNFMLWWFTTKLLINVVCFLIMLFRRFPIRLFNKLNQLYDKNKVPDISILGRFEDPYSLKTDIIAPKTKTCSSIHVRLPPSTQLLLPMHPLSFGSFTGNDLRDKVLSCARSGRIDMAEIPLIEVDYIIQNVEFSTLLVRSRYNKKRLIVLWKDIIFKKSKRIKGFNMKVFCHHNRDIVVSSDGIIELIQQYNPVSITEWRQLIGSVHDKLAIMKNVPKQVLLSLITHGRNHTKLFDIFTNTTNIPEDIVTELPYKLLKRINRLNGYSILERLAFSGSNRRLSSRISNHLTRNISRSFRLFSRLTYRDLYPKYISWRCEKPVRISPFIDITTHDWAVLKLSPSIGLGEHKTKLLSLGLASWWMMI